MKTGPETGPAELRKTGKFMAPEIRTTDYGKSFKDFIRLPARIHAQHKNWLPPLYADEKMFFSPDRNKAFGYCETIMAVAYVNNEPRGRIMGIIHREYNQQHNEKSARFGFFDCYDEPEVAKALLDFIRDWAIGRGMEDIYGPYGFSDRDPQGFLVEGFDDPPLIDTNCNLPYMPGLLEKSGFVKFVDCLTYRFDLNLVLPEVYQRTSQRVENSHRYELLEFTSKKTLLPYIVPVLRLTNETYSHLYGFYPLSETEMHDLYKRYSAVLNPDYVKIITCNGEIVAYVVGVANMSEGFRKAKGRLFPLGWYHILRSLKTATQLNLMLGAVSRHQQGLGLEVWMGLKMLESAKKAGIETIETHLILETNARMRAVFERLNVPVVKRFRVYRKSLV
ncbi:MAG: hypothetical protein IPF68_16125 [Bacteroidales bacterium]|nr:hypothetical protein [Bacteroidales bacterium]